MGWTGRENQKVSGCRACANGLRGRRRGRDGECGVCGVGGGGWEEQGGHVKMHSNMSEGRVTSRSSQHAEGTARNGSYFA